MKLIVHGKCLQIVGTRTELIDMAGELLSRVSTPEHDFDSRDSLPRYIEFDEVVDGGELQEVVFLRTEEKSPRQLALNWEPEE